MDKILMYKKIVRDLITEIASGEPEEENGLENQLITDDEHGHYLWFGVGWEYGTRYFYATFIHIDVKKTGRVWLQHDGTSLRIADMLEARGVPKSDIVIGFQDPESRKMMDYAVA
jgi:XisI protein